MKTDIKKDRPEAATSGRQLTAKTMKTIYRVSQSGSFCKGVR